MITKTQAELKSQPICDVNDHRPNCCEKITDYFNKSIKFELNTYDHSEPISPSQTIKILVLGPGDSGKSTILKQMRIIHGKNYTIEERKKYTLIILQNIIDSVFRLVDAMKMFDFEFENEEINQELQLLNHCKEQLKYDLNDWFTNLSIYTPIIKKIWEDKSIRSIVQKRNQFYLNDSTEYFMNSLNRICSVNYVPEIDDILRARQPTTAIMEYKFKISGTYFLFVDVGGQRSERRKWINCFENITTLLFVASLSDYDLKMSLDELRSSNSDTSEDVNRMRDALDLFRTLINWRKKNYRNSKQSDDGNSTQKVEETLLFEKVSIILFLNKEDLFEEKFKRSSLKVCFKDYIETDSSSKAKEFIAKKFIECDRSSQISKNNQRDIYWHYTFALDRKNVETVIASVKEKILKYMLESMRL